AGAGLVAGFAFTMYRSRRAALYSAVLYAASTQLMAQAQSVRMYTLLGFLSAASMWLFVCIFREGAVSETRPLGSVTPMSGSDRHRLLHWLYVGVNAFGILTQIWFGFVIFGQLVYLMLWRRETLRKFLSCSAAAGLVFLAVWGPAFLVQLRSG